MFIGYIDRSSKLSKMSKYSAVLEIKACMADDVTFVENYKKMRISCFHIQMKIHIIVSLAFLPFFSTNICRFIEKNTEELENWVRILKKGAQVPVFDSQHDVIMTKYGGKGTNFLSPEIKMKLRHAEVKH